MDGWNGRIDLELDLGSRKYKTNLDVFFSPSILDGHRNSFPDSRVLSTQPV